MGVRNRGSIEQSARALMMPKFGPGDQFHPCCDKRVSSEQRHIPRRSCGRHYSIRMVGVEDAQRTEIVLRLAEDSAQHRIVGVESCRICSPRSESDRVQGLLGGVGTARPALTSNSEPKSSSASKVMSSPTDAVPKLRTSTDSDKPLPTERVLSTTIVLSIASPLR